ncbi:MAG: hypothetical protein IJT73_00875 [Selenomonadaceae bacterium]|nr:hypothetical protein [Selenomonadaceae bacterium]
MENEFLPHFNQHSTCANDSERRVFLIIPEKNLQTEIVDAQGRFVNFPGIENPDFIAQFIRMGSLKPVAEFVTWFETDKDGKFLVIWEVQPDGWYWADDGFGAEPDYEIRLYSYLDENGKFLFPFKIYNIGKTEYFGTNLEEEAAKEFAKKQEADRKNIESGKTAEETTKLLIAKSLNLILNEQDQWPEDIYFYIPQSKYMAKIGATKDLLKKGNWRLQVSVFIEGSDMLRSVNSLGFTPEEFLKYLQAEQTHEEIFNDIINLVKAWEK